MWVIYVSAFLVVGKEFQSMTTCNWLYISHPSLLVSCCQTFLIDHRQRTYFRRPVLVSYFKVRQMKGDGFAWWGKQTKGTICKSNNTRSRSTSIAAHS